MQQLLFPSEEEDADEAPPKSPAVRNLPKRFEFHFLRDIREAPPGAPHPLLWRVVFRSTGPCEEALPYMQDALSSTPCEAVRPYAGPDEGGWGSTILIYGPSQEWLRGARSLLIANLQHVPNPDE